ncbi:MAG: mechanosensitive ion channel family protein [Deltaproteobacteria bacterium]|nr:mechanosensitive ion channel family protein [Deltaproteobacteria bacterium]
MDDRLGHVIDLLSGVSPNPLVQAALIVLAFGGMAKIADVLMTRVLQRWLVKTRIALDDQILAIVHKPIFVSIMLFGLALAKDRLDLSETLAGVALALLKTMAIFIWSLAAARFVQVALTALSRDGEERSFIQARTLPLFKNLLMILLVALAAYFVCLAWDINVTAWMASAGIVGLAISFAAKDTLANLFAGVFILADAPYKIGDFIELDSGERGEVTHIGIRSTRMLTRDDVEITVPNAIMGNTKIINEAGGPSEKYRIRIKVGVAYGSDIDKVHKVLMDVALNRPEVCRTPEPRVRFRAFGDSSLDHELLCWVERPVMRGKVTHLLNTDVYKRFLAEGIEIPFPQRDVHVKTLPKDESQ